MKEKETTNRDFFISHASEDKEDIACSIAKYLIDKGFKVWFDELALKVKNMPRRIQNTYLLDLSL